jgi:plasmid stabilization system protein ParE
MVKKADKRFDQIIEHINLKFGKTSAENFVRKVYNIIELISYFPQLGSLENELYSIRGFVIVEQVTVFYQVRKDKIILLNFYDNRQNPKKNRF